MNEQQAGCNESRNRIQARAIASVLAERIRQDQRWGADRVLPRDRWLALLAEEFGESATEVNDFNDANDLAITRSIEKLRSELIQVAAVAIAWVEQLDRENPCAPDDGN